VGSFCLDRSPGPAMPAPSRRLVTVLSGGPSVAGWLARESAGGGADGGRRRFGSHAGEADLSRDAAFAARARPARWSPGWRDGRPAGAAGVPCPGFTASEASEQVSCLREWSEE
jgi:hypothetical protein